MRALSCIGLALMAAMLAGCITTSQTDIVSEYDTTSSRLMGSIFVISHLALVEESWAARFESAIQDELHHAGVHAWVQTRDPVGVKFDRARYAEELSSYKPDGVLVLEPGHGTIDKQGRHYLRRFTAGLFEYGSSEEHREPVWRASLLVQPSGPFIRPNDFAVLAHDLVVQLAEDGFVMRPSTSRMP